MNKPLPKNAVIGILGGGQLGLMTAQAAVEMGYRCHIFAPEGEAVACAIADFSTRADYSDTAALAKFAQAIDTVTCEFENVPAEALDTITSTNPNCCAISPGRYALEVAQHRVAEKTLAKELGIKTPNFVPIQRAEDIAPALASGIATMANGAILKTCRFGYDGKGQVQINHEHEAHDAFAMLASTECILEEKIDFTAEASFLIARNVDGEISHFPPSINNHHNGILAYAQAPADPKILPKTLRAYGENAIARLAHRLNLIGLLAMEVFITKDGLVFNEIAPRPHNSFHWTIEGAETSQFAQLVRVITGQPLGSAAAVGRWRMDNVLGEDLGGEDLPLLDQEGVFVHRYGKKQAKPGRKMGHITRKLAA